MFVIKLLYLHRNLINKQSGIRIAVRRNSPFQQKRNDPLCNTLASVGLQRYGFLPDFNTKVLHI